jgi:hypothetical protein
MQLLGIPAQRHHHARAQLELLILGNIALQQLHAHAGLLAGRSGAVARPPQPAPYQTQDQCDARAGTDFSTTALVCARQTSSASQTAAQAATKPVP